MQFVKCLKGEKVRERKKKGRKEGRKKWEKRETRRSESNGKNRSSRGIQKTKQNEGRNKQKPPLGEKCEQNDAKRTKNTNKIIIKKRERAEKAMKTVTSTKQRKRESKRK